MLALRRYLTASSVHAWRRPKVGNRPVYESFDEVLQHRCSTCVFAVVLSRQGHAAFVRLTLKCFPVANISVFICSHEYS